jgi:hypothetical protein
MELMTDQGHEVFELNQMTEPESTTTSTKNMFADRGAILGIEQGPIHTSEPPPVDRGRHAWGCLAGAFMVEAIFTGKALFIFTVNVFTNRLNHIRPPVLFRCIPNLLQRTYLFRR